AIKSKEFQTLFADRVYKAIANNGPLTDANSQKRWDTLNNYIKDAIVGESARWGDALQSYGQPTRTRSSDWQPEVDKIRSEMSGNGSQLISALRSYSYYPSINPPTYSQQGGLVAANYK